MTDMSGANGAFVPHEVLWDNSKIARYWDYLSGVPTALNKCWSKQVGAALIRYVLRRTSLHGRLLDYGCGPGFLIHDLLATARRAAVFGVEYSPVSVRLVNDRYRGHERFGGVTLASTIPTSFDSGFFDGVFFVETIEHILPPQRDGVLRELRRLLRPGGIVVVTTPNEEDLAANKAVCPDCGGTFHVVQHVSSWSSEALQDTMERVGFHTVSSRATHLRVRRPLLGALADRILRRHPPHLVYLGVVP